MAEIEALPWNGYRVVSTFAGGGGSSTGYRMAGFRIALANEFVAAARETYAANMRPGTILDGANIRDVDPVVWLERIGLARGELDVLDGSPPCAAFSMAGKREKKWGKVSAYLDTAQRSDDLFYEFIRVLDGLQPKVFVAENVAGLVRGTAKGYFLRILAALRAAGYEVEARLLDASRLGVPQARIRLIFVGVRRDLVERYGVRPAFPAPFADRYVLADALALTEGMPVEPEADMRPYAVGKQWATLDLGGQSAKYFQLIRAHPREPVGTVTATAGAPSAASISHPYECRKFSVAETKALCGFPLDYRLAGDYGQQIERLGRAVPPLMMKAVAEAIRREVLDAIS